jgi:hypothetical protein
MVGAGSLWPKILPLPYMHTFDDWMYSSCPYYSVSWENVHQFPKDLILSPIFTQRTLTLYVPVFYW